MPGVLGVGISSSIDSPGEAAILIYVAHGTNTEALPAVIDGVRTRIRETSPFVAGRDANAPARSCRVPASTQAKPVAANLAAQGGLLVPHF